VYLLTDAKNDQPFRGWREHDSEWDVSTRSQESPYGFIAQSDIHEAFTVPLHGDRLRKMSFQRIGRSSSQHPRRIGEEKGIALFL